MNGCGTRTTIGHGEVLICGTTKEPDGSIYICSGCRMVAYKELSERLAEMVFAKDGMLDFIQSAPVSSGVCCCGDSIDRHADPMHCGHTPVDSWDHAVNGIVEEFEKIRQRLKDAGILK